MPIRVILIDDEQTILDGMKQLINWSEHGFQLIGTFSSLLKALDFFWYMQSISWSQM
ncbi:hypothetical protein OZZ93_02570 [Enterococcus sp. E4-152]|nr:hypothetical protein [Enterococcus sp. E4-152]